MMAIRFALVLLVAVFLSACAMTRVDNSAHTLQRERSQLQLQLGYLSDALWQRSGRLLDTSHRFPLTSQDPKTLEQLNQQLKLQISQAQQALQQVDQRVQQRYQQAFDGNLLRLSLLKGVSESSPDTLLHTQTLHAEPVVLAKGERKLWPMMSTTKMELELIWSENGDLYIEGQNVMTLSSSMNPSMIETPFITNISWYQQKISAQSQLQLTLCATLKQESTALTECSPP